MIPRFSLGRVSPTLVILGLSLGLAAGFTLQTARESIAAPETSFQLKEQDRATAEIVFSEQLQSQIQQRDFLANVVSEKYARRSFLAKDPQVEAYALELGKIEQQYKRLSKNLKPAHPEMLYLQDLEDGLRKKISLRQSRVISDLKSDLKVVDRKILETRQAQAETLANLPLAESIRLPADEKDKSKFLSSLEFLTGCFFIGLAIIFFGKHLHQNSRPKPLFVRATNGNRPEEDFSGISNFPKGREPAILEERGNTRQAIATQETPLSKQIEVKQESRRTGAQVFVGGENLDQDSVVHLFPYEDFESLETSDLSSSLAMKNSYHSLTQQILSQQTVKTEGDKNRGSCILVSSPLGSEGRTQVSYNLGNSLAEAGYRTLLVEAELDWPAPAAKNGGLADFLRGELSAEQITQKTAVSGFYCISAGNVEPDSRDMLCSKQMWLLCESLQATFDFIVFAGPPLLSNNDSLIFAEIADSLVLAVERNVSDVSLTREALDKLERTGTSVSRIILNQSEYAGTTSV